ncbi:MAG TPA: hypothetical protein VF980_03480 [Thermoanaerobaculia bacterium]
MNKQRLATAPLTVPALIGFAAAVLIAPLLVVLKPLFPVPGHGIGLVSVMRYPKGWDYAVVAILFFVAAAVTLIAAYSSGPHPRFALPSPARGRGRIGVVCVLMLIVTAAILPARDNPYEFADPYHEGENLSPASVMLAGGRPYRDVWFMHAVAADGGLDLLVLGDPPSIVRTRRMRAILSTATVAFLVPIAAELSSTWTGAICATILSLCSIAAGQLPSTPHFRLLPLLLAIWLALIAIRTRRGAYGIAACAIASAGLVWSLDVGLFAVAGLAGWLIVARPFDRKTLAACAAAIVFTAPLLLLALRADISRFFRDSFLRLPECFDAIYSLPAPPFAMTWPSVRYYVPPIVYGVVFALAILYGARGERQRANALLLLAITAFFEFRTAAGRHSWGHLRFSLPLLGIMVVCFAIEPLIRSRRASRIAVGVAIAIAAIPYFEVIANAKALGNYYSTYRERLRPKPDTVPFPLPRAHDLFTYRQEAAELGALYHFSQSMPPGPIFDYSGEKYLYYMLARPASTRCHDIPYLSDPALGREAMHQLERRPPVFVVVAGHPTLANIDGISNAQRTPQIAQWIDAHYPRRIKVGRYTVGLPSAP